jgi:Tol biopolymer transport system component
MLTFKTSSQDMKSVVRIGLLLLLMLSSSAVSAQFYNGMQMNFGKNRLQYNNRYWKYYRFDRFDVYSYENGTDLSLYVADFVKKELALIERFFDYDIERRIIFLTYNKLSDFRQSNIGLVSEAEEYNIGGTTNIIQNKVFLYFDGDHMNFERQIRAGIAEVLVSEMMFGKGVRDNLTSSTMINLPEWYLEGLISFVSNPWDYELENRVKDGIVSGRYKKFVKLQDDDARYAGHSFWKYVADLYGVSIIPQILYITKINKNAESGFHYVLGSKLKDLSIDWSAYYLGLYTSTEESAGLPEQGEILKKPHKRRVYQNIKISPDGRMVAYVTNQKGQYKVWIHNEATGKQKKIYKRGEKLDQIHDYSFPELAWHPSSQILGFVTEEKGELKFHIYNLETGVITTRNLLLFEKILDLSFSPDGRKLVFSAVVDGQTDIWVFDIAASTNDRITNDLADDFNPKFINNMNNITFVSNRRSDTLFMENDPEYNTTTAFAVYVYDYAGRSPVLQKISEGDYINHAQPLSPRHNEFFYLSDKNGIVNRYYARYDSTISMVDTTIHYRYFANSFPLSNYKRNILSQDINTETEEIAEIVYNDRRYYMYKYPMEFEKRFGDQLENTIYQDRHVQRLTAEDSVHHVEKKVISMKDIADNMLVHQGDTIELQEFKIDVNNYIFEREKLNYYNDQLRDINLNLVLDSTENERMMYIDYSTAFYPDKLVSQVDFSFLNASYQAFTGGAFYYNPGLNLLFKVGANDLFEDYRIVGGVRFATDFDSNEYLLSFENLKQQLDKQLVFHRQVFKNYIDSRSIVKTYTHELLASVKYPLTQTLALKGTASFRHDNSVYLSTSSENLNKSNLLKVWGGLKAELIFDNTRQLGTNLYTGMRWKVFGEAYRQINEAKSDLFVVGGDFRHYLRIHRSLIWANRIAGSGSFGRSPLIYYLGSVDNWINLNQSDNPTFNETVDIDYSQNYAYQALATNLRGFSQNIRNGSNFLVINTELRWPIFRYLAGHPLGSGFLNNFQVVGFADIGTAWSGLHPFSDENAWNTEIIENGPMTITLDANREPIVMGYGFGLRAQLLGYFIRLDWAWGVENMVVQPRMFYLSLSLDF